MLSPRGTLLLPLAALAGFLTTGCTLFLGDQSETLDLAALRPDEGYAVGTFTTVELFDNGTSVVLIANPDIRYEVDFDKLPPDSVEVANKRIIVHGEEGPTFFAVKLNAGPHRVHRVSIPGGNMTRSADVDQAFDVAPGAITYLGDIRCQLDSRPGLFGMHNWMSVTTTVREDRALLDRLMHESFPDASSDVRVALARSETEPTRHPFF
jgi:hypothetical protein